MSSPRSASRSAGFGPPASRALPVRRLGVAPIRASFPVLSNRAFIQAWAMRRAKVQAAKPSAALALPGLAGPKRRSRAN